MNGSGELGVRRRLTIRASELGSARSVRHCKAEADGRGRSFCLFRRGPMKCFLSQMPVLLAIRWIATSIVVHPCSLT